MHAVAAHMGTQECLRNGDEGEHSHGVGHANEAHDQREPDQGRDNNTYNEERALVGRT
jgi:hypothetical protein